MPIEREMGGHEAPRALTALRGTVLALVVIGLQALWIQQSTSRASEPEGVLKLDDEIATRPLLELHAGDTWAVELSRNGGTGFFWQAIVEDPLVVAVTLSSSRLATEKTNPPIVGRPEIDRFILKAKAIGETTITYHLIRAKGIPLRSTTLRVRVQPKG